MYHTFRRWKFAFTIRFYLHALCRYTIIIFIIVIVVGLYVRICNASRWFLIIPFETFSLIFGDQNFTWDHEWMYKMLHEKQLCPSQKGLASDVMNTCQKLRNDFRTFLPFNKNIFGHLIMLFNIKYDEEIKSSMTRTRVIAIDYNATKSSGIKMKIAGIFKPFWKIHQKR